MAGKRHHFIPRFLQEGFAESGTKGAPKAWVFNKDGRRFKTNVINSGVEGYFYGKEDERGIDKEITRFEESIAPVLQKIRDGSLDPGLVEILPSVFAHFEVRTRNLRLAFVDSAQLLMDQLVAFFQDETRFVPFFKKRIIEDPSLIEDSIREKVKELGLGREHYEIARQEARKNLPQILDELTPQYQLMAENLSRQLSAGLMPAATAGHLIPLETEIAPEVRAAQYSELVFRILPFPAGAMILGDSIVLFETDDPLQPFRSLVDKGRDVKHALLPLSSKVLLAGSKRGEEFRHDASRVREEFARSSQEFFLADRESVQNNTLAEKIGTRTALLSEGAIHKIAEDCLGKTV